MGQRSYTAAYRSDAVRLAKEPADERFKNNKDKLGKRKGVSDS